MVEQQIYSVCQTYLERTRVLFINHLKVSDV